MFLRKSIKLKSNFGKLSLENIFFFLLNLLSYLYGLQILNRRKIFLF